MKTYSVWWDNSPPDFALQTQLPTSADLVIVGAGFAGMSAAYWALRYAKTKKQRLRILILDAAPHAGFKASGRMNGSVYLGSNLTPQVMVDCIGKTKAKKLYTYSDANNALLRHVVSKQGIDCEAEFNGGFRMAATAREAVDLDKSADILTHWGFCSARFDHDQSQHITVTPRMKGSLYLPGEGMIDPFAFCGKMARLMRENHVKIVYGVRVEDADTVEGHGPRLYLSNGHILNASRIIHTTQHSAPSWDRLYDALVSSREQVVSTEPLSEDLEDMPLPLMPIEFNDGLDSIRMNGRSVVMTGGKAGLKTDPDAGEFNDSFTNQRVLQHLDKTMMSHFPVTNLMPIEYIWSYIETTTVDGLPLMGEMPHSDGHYLNIAHGRNKFGLAFLGAKNIIERAFRVKVSNPEFKIFDPKRLVRGE